MPFDSASTQTIGHLRLERVALALRDPQSWPRGFKFDYSLIDSTTDRRRWWRKLCGLSCGTSGCAIGLAYLLWDDARHAFADQYAGAWHAADYFGIPAPDAQSLFFECETYGHSQMADVRPEQVADAIDHYLAEKGVANAI